MSITGQADSGPVSTDDLAAFLVDNPGADESTETKDEPITDEADEKEASDDSPAEDDEPSDDEAEQTSERKVKVTVKGEDGADQTLEVDEKELIAGYQRHSDYTRKTQELGHKEREVTQALAGEYQQMRSHYTEQAQLASAAITQLAGLKSPEDMAVLAQTDPAAWVQEQQRAGHIQNVLSQLHRGLQQEQTQVNQQREQQRTEAFRTMWTTLRAEGFDRPKIESLYSKAAEAYQLTGEQLGNVMSATEIHILRDAVAYQELKAHKADVTKRADKAPPLPAQRQTAPQNEQRMKVLNTRFASGKAKLSDLADYINQST